MMKYVFTFMAMVISITGISSSPSLAATRVTEEQVQFFNQAAESCGNQFKGKALVGCVGKELDNLSSGLNSADIPLKAPKASPHVRATAVKVKRATSKSAATSVLNRARSVMRGLSAKSSGPAKVVYKRVASAYSRAISVIRRKF